MTSQPHETEKGQLTSDPFAMDPVGCDRMHRKPENLCRKLTYLRIFNRIDSRHATKEALVCAA